MSGRWNLDHRSQARISGTVRLDEAPRFAPPVLMLLDGQPAFSVPTRADGSGVFRFDIVLGSWVPSHRNEIVLSAAGAEAITIPTTTLDPEPSVLRSHIDCVTARAIVGWAFWTERGTPIECFELFVDFLPVESKLRRMRREDLGRDHGSDDDLGFELTVSADITGSTISIRADGACALFVTAVRPTYFLKPFKRLHRGSLAVVAVSPVHEAGVNLMCAGRSFPQLPHASALGVGAGEAAFFVVPADLLDDVEQGFFLAMPSQRFEMYRVERA